MYRDLFCSICGAPQHQSARWDESNPHVKIECGNWDQLMAEFGRIHNLNPEEAENLLRVLIRTHDMHYLAIEKAWEEKNWVKL